MENYDFRNIWRSLFVIFNTLSVLAIPFVYFMFIFGLFGFWEPPTLSTKIQGIATLVIYLIIVLFVNKWLLKRIDLRGWKFIFLMLLIIIVVAIMLFLSKELSFYFVVFFETIMSFFCVKFKLLVVRNM